MKYLLDANVVIRMLSRQGETLRRRLAECDEGEITTSSIVFAEVALGSINGKSPPEERLQAFVEEIPVLPFDHAAARTYAALPFKRGSYDRLIAAHALALGLTLVTDNVGHFSDVPGLKVENWAA